MNTSQAALHYYAAGWHPLELPPGAKHPPPEGRTGHRGTDMTSAEVVAAPWAGNLGVRMPRDVLGLDVDVYHGGDVTLDELLALCGPLPKTWISHNGRNDGSGIRFYRVPVGMGWITGLPGIEIIQWGHRYAAVYPSIHPDGRPYGVWDQAEDAPAPDGLPLVEDLPELPWPWIARLARSSSAEATAGAPTDAASLTELQDFLEACTEADEPNYLSVIVAHFLERTTEGYSRHDSMQAALIRAMECARAGIHRADSALKALGLAWSSVFTKADEARRAELVSAVRVTEYDAMARYAVGKATAKSPEEMLALHDAIAGVPIHAGTATAPPRPEPERLRDGATFILDEPAELEARWGRGAEVLWARGESVLICGPAGVGKTTLAGQLVAGLIGAEAEVLGYPVTPATRVLYLAMDRPRQVRRAFRRLFTEDHRQALAERLVVLAGPLPADLGTHPQLLLELARTVGADVIVMDSLKDAAVKLTDDLVGGNVNRAIQLCNAVGVDTAVLHHQRKSGPDAAKPTTLADVYGSTWLSAGAGSVVLLWGEPGSEQIELTHLKQPAEVVGPLTVEHDHLTGRSKVTRGWDALTYLTHRGPSGATLAQATAAHHGATAEAGSAKWKRTERKLRRLVADGLATVTAQAAVGDAVTYYAILTATVDEG